MTLAEKQQRLIDDFAVIPDYHERLAAVVSRTPRTPPLAPADKIDANRVPGCVSTVWLVGEINPAGKLRLRVDAESPLVKGIVSLLVELYDDTAPAEAACVEPDMLEALELTQNLSPTRRNGLAAVRKRIREFASATTHRGS